MDLDNPAPTSSAHRPGPDVVAAWAEVASPVGPLRCAITDTGVAGIGFAANESRDAFLERLTARGRAPRHDPDAIEPLAAALSAYFDGELRDFDIPVDLRDCTPFARSVLEAGRRVPYGALQTYAAIAAEIGDPGAVRAVGGALGRNPVPILIPCHRIVASRGKLGGYSGGLAIKRQLLQLEGSMLI